MAPRLPPNTAIQLNSLGWPVWLLCTSITVAVFSMLALFAYSRVQASEDQRRRKHMLLQQYGQGAGAGAGAGSAEEVMWSFPEKEDKAARFKRWAEVLRFKPREARPPISSDGARLDVKVALEVFYREAQAAGISPPGLPDSPRHQALRISEEEVAEMLREKVKERILQFLMECGPAKGLCVISEEDRSVAGTPAASVPSTPRAYGGSGAVPSTPSRQHAVDMRKLMESYASDSSAPSTPRAPSGTRRGQAPPALALDGEPVLRTETGETVTRELLWAVLARIHAEAQAQAQAETQAAAAALSNSVVPTPPAAAPLSASAIAGRPESDSLKQPLLGEWKNPLQQSVE